MQEIRLRVPLTPEQVKDRLAAAFDSPPEGAPEFVRTADRQFCHVKPYGSPRRGMLWNATGVGPLFVGMHLKELGSETVITISPMTTGYLLAAKLLLMPALWIIAPVLAIHQEGWRIAPKMLLACTLITAFLWLLQRASLKTERTIIRKIRETFDDQTELK